MNLEKIDEILESLLFVSGEGLKISDIIHSLDLQKTEINASIRRLKKKYCDDCGINLIEFNGKIQFCTNPKYAQMVEDILNPIRERALSSAALETVAIIAYRQPITRLEIEQVRGVSCDYALSVLLKNNLIEVVGRKDAIGKPLMFGTTDTFLKRFRIESIDQLPDYNNLLESINVINEKNKSSSLYNEFELPEENTPEFLQGESIEKVEGDSVEKI